MFCCDANVDDVDVVVNVSVDVDKWDVRDVKVLSSLTPTSKNATHNFGASIGCQNAAVPKGNS